MLDGLFLASTVTAVRAALASAGAQGTVIVVGDVRLAKALRAADGAGVVIVAAKPPRGVPDAIIGTIDKIPVDAGAAVACIGVATGGAVRAGAVGEWCRVVRDGGAVVIVDRRPPAESTRAALCAGLTEIEQRTTGRVTVTSGLVTPLP